MDGFIEGVMLGITILGILLCIFLAFCLVVALLISAGMSEKMALISVGGVLIFLLICGILGYISNK